jgi:hypothetical protein
MPESLHDWPLHRLRQRSESLATLMVAHGCTESWWRTATQWVVIASRV